MDAKGCFDRYLYNGGNELNDSTGWYETFFREYQRFGPGSGNNWADQYSNPTRDHFMMSGGDFEAKYGVSAVEYHDQLIFQRAVNEGEGFTGSIWDYTPWGSIHEYRFVDGKPTELTTYAYYLDGKEGIINHHVLAQMGNKDFQESIVDGFQNGLGAVGLIPAVGEIFDGANGLIYLARGDKVNAGLSFAATAPLLGWGATIGKWGRKTYKVYHAVDASGTVKYVGITSENWQYEKPNTKSKMPSRTCDFWKWNQTYLKSMTE